jgi:AraC family transcriptional regulator, exoenzyme S synthesis regulatory protein ExsA
MNTTDIKQRVDQSGWLSSAKVLKFNGEVAIQSCTGNAVNSLLVKDNMLLFVMEGTFQIRYGTSKYAIEKNHMVFLKKDILVECSEGLQSGCPGNSKFIIIYFKYDLLKEFVKLSQVTVVPSQCPSPVTVDAIDVRLLKFIESLESYFPESENIEEYLIKIKLLELLFNLAQIDNDILPQLMDLRPHFRADITTTVEENVMSPMSLSQLAVLSGRSLSSFRRDFFAIYNMPPSTWLRKRRLEKARELLLNTTMTVTDVCYTLGFESLAHFSRLFKAHFGNSPSKSRNQ